LQWDRRCLENYLIDLDIIPNLLMDSEIVNTPYTNHGEIIKLLKDLAFRQLDEVATRKVYQSYAFESTGIKKDEIKGKPITEISAALFTKIHIIQTQISHLNEFEWKNKFEAEATQERLRLENIWDVKWMIDCDGKRLFEDLQSSVQLKINIRRFKTRIIKEMAINQSELWTTTQALLEKLIG